MLLNPNQLFAFLPPGDGIMAMDDHIPYGCILELVESSFYAYGPSYALRVSTLVRPRQELMVAIECLTPLIVDEISET